VTLRNRERDRVESQIPAPQLRVLVPMGPNGEGLPPIRCSSWAAIEAHLRRLDGRHRSGFFVAREADESFVIPPYATVAGGDAGRCQASVTYDEAHFLVLRWKPDAPGPVTVNLAGQPVELDAEEAVPLDLAIEACRSFIVQLTLDPAHQWAPVGPQRADPGLRGSRDIQ